MRVRVCACVFAVRVHACVHVRVVRAHVCPVRVPCVRARVLMPAHACVHMRARRAQMGLALDFMHQRNVLHRDLKTQNVFLKGSLAPAEAAAATAVPLLRLGDFGISKVRACG